MLSFDNSIVLITGGGSGIGLALARQFVSEGATVVICGRDKVKLDRAYQEIPGLQIAQCDVTMKEDCRKLLLGIEERFGRLDVLVNNAGIYGRHEFLAEDFDPQAAELIMQTNFIAPIQLAHLALPLLRKSVQPMIVNVTSGLAYAPLPRAPIYSASKSALHFFTAAVARQKHPFPIRIVEVLPPIVDTAMAQHAKLLKMPVDVFARKTVKQLKRGRREIRIGGTTLLYWSMRLMPTLALKVMNRF